MFTLSRRHFASGAALAALELVAPSAFAAGVADTIYSGGPILTIDDASPRVEAVAVKNGRIIASGAASDVMRLKGDATQMIDPGGRTMLPGFVDPHGHVTVGGLQALSANMLPPPDGPNTDIAQIQQTLDQIKVVETIKEGQSIYKASPEKRQKKEDAGRSRGKPFSDFLVRLAAGREIMNLPQERQTPMMRKLIAAAPHNNGCVSNLVADLTRAMLGQA